MSSSQPIMRERTALQELVRESRLLSWSGVKLTVFFLDKTLKVPETPFPDLCSIYSSLWKEFHPDATVSTEPTIEQAIRRAEQISHQEGAMEAFVTGSLHLVGGALSLLRP